MIEIVLLFVGWCLGYLICVRYSRGKYGKMISGKGQPFSRRKAENSEPRSGASVVIHGNVSGSSNVICGGNMIVNNGVRALPDPTKRRT